MVNPKNILLTGGRSPTALFLARELAKEGHRIFVAETSTLHVCRFSNAVTKTFVVPSPRFETEQFLTRIAQIAKEEQIDLILPTYEEILYLAKGADQIPQHCLRWIPPFEQLNHLHNKWLFHHRLLEYGLRAPRTYLIRTPEEIPSLSFTENFAMKPCYSRASQQVVRMTPGNPIPPVTIEEHNPWVAQEWLAGKKYCTYSLARNGRLLAHAAYPVEYSINGDSCLVFEAIQHPEIQQWVEHFVEKENFSGQIAFDFIVTDDGILYPIECNPRATSGLYLLAGEGRLDEIFFSSSDKEVVRMAKQGTSRQIATGMLLYGWKTAYQESKLRPFFRTFFRVEDVVFNVKDIKPFLFVPFVMMQYITQSRKWDLKVFAAFTYDCDWNNESAENLQL